MVLVDTHALVWLALEPKRLSKKATQLLLHANRSGGLAIASITLWEMAMLCARQRMAINGTFTNWVTELLANSGVAVLELTPTIAELSTSFGPDYPRDHGDQIIGATARAHGLTLVTADERMRACPLLNCVW